VLPVHSVGVQGDSRSEPPGLAVEHAPFPAEAAELVNRIASVNRVVQLARSHAPASSIEIIPSTLSESAPRTHAPGRCRRGRMDEGC
jgi:hypothetical protein